MITQDYWFRLTVWELHLKPSSYHCSQTAQSLSFWSSDLCLVCSGGQLQISVKLEGVSFGSGSSFFITTSQSSQLYSTLDLLTVRGQSYQFTATPPGVRTKGVKLVYKVGPHQKCSNFSHRLFCLLFMLCVVTAHIRQHFILTWITVMQTFCEIIVALHEDQRS